MSLPSGPVELVEAQLRGIEAWNAARAAAERARLAVPASREARLDLARRMDVLREQHRAIVERADAQLRESVHLLPVERAPRAVVAHRNAWFTNKVSLALQDLGVEVVARTDNGAHAVGCVVAEQPDLLLLEDVLPMLTGADVVREVRDYAPSTRVGAHVAHVGRLDDLLAAGAHAAWARQVPPADVADGLVQLLQSQPAAAATSRAG